MRRRWGCSRTMIWSAGSAAKRVLLVLDNLEQLKGVDVVVAELLVGETTVFATSRAPLRVASERELPVDPLPQRGGG